METLAQRNRQIIAQDREQLHCQLAAYNAAWALYKADELEGCIKAAGALLEDGTLHRYFRIKALLLLAATLDDWHAAQTRLEEANELWRVTRRLNPAGQDDRVDTWLAELRPDLDSLRQQQLDDQPEVLHYFEDDDIEEEGSVGAEQGASGMKELTAEGDGAVEGAQHEAGGSIT